MDEDRPNIDPDEPRDQWPAYVGCLILVAFSGIVLALAFSWGILSGAFQR
jgi:hypothetical protein